MTDEKIKNEMGISDLCKCTTAEKCDIFNAFNYFLLQHTVTFYLYKMYGIYILIPEFLKRIFQLYMSNFIFN